MLAYASLLTGTSSARAVNSANFTTLFPPSLGRPSSRFRCFINYPPQRRIRAFYPSEDDVNFVYDKVGYHLRSLRYREWKPPAEVSPYLDHPPFLDILDLTTTTLIGSKLFQGLGISGPGIRLAFLEEVGRYPGHGEDILALLYSWDRGSLILGRIPIKYLIPTGVREVFLVPNGRVYVTWKDVTQGILTGASVTAWLTDWTDDFVILTDGDSGVVMDEE